MSQLPTFCAVGGLLPPPGGDHRPFDLPLAGGGPGPSGVGSGAAGSGGGGLAALEGLGFPPAAEQSLSPLEMQKLFAEIQDIRGKLDAQPRSAEDKKKKKQKRGSKSGSRSGSDGGHRHSGGRRRSRRRRRRGSGSSSPGRRRRRGHRRRRSSSDSDAPSRRSRSRSSSRSSTESYLRWRPRARNRLVGPTAERRLEGEKFKARGDLLSFAARRPGALSAFFLAMVHRKLCQGRITQSKPLRRMSVTTWAQQHSGLTEQRDLKEVLTLATVVDLMNSDDLSAAMDVMTQRIAAIQRAKSKSCSWEKAENLELVVGPQLSTAAGGLLRLSA